MHTWGTRTMNRHESRYDCQTTYAPWVVDSSDTGTLRCMKCGAIVANEQYQAMYNKMQNKRHPYMGWRSNEFRKLLHVVSVLS